MITGDKKEPRTKGWLPSRSVTSTGGSQRETGDSPGRFTFAAPPAGVHSDDLCECVDDLPLALWALGRSSDGRGGWCYRHRQSSVPKASYPKSKPTSFLPFREGRSVPGKSVSLGEAQARSLARRSPEKVAGRNLRTSQKTPVPTVSQASVLSASASAGPLDGWPCSFRSGSLDYRGRYHWHNAMSLANRLFPDRMSTIPCVDRVPSSDSLRP